MRAFPLVVLSICLGVDGFGAEAVAVKIGQATSPDGNYSLVAAMDEESTCRVEVRATAAGKATGRISILDYYADDHRYSITALWKEDSTAFAVNINYGRNITDCRFFIRGPQTWTELSLPKKPIEKLRKAGNKEGGKEQDYLHVMEWQPGNQVQISYQGNLTVQTGAIFRLVRTGRPHLELVKFIEAKSEEEKVVVNEVPCTFRVFAGSDAGSADGPVASAQFKWPSGVAVDAAGNVFVADRGNHTLRRINPAGVVETLAGSPGEFGAVDGTGKEARLWYPQCLAVDGQGNVYVADTSGNRVRKVTPKGVVTTLVSDLNFPNGVAVDRDGNVYVADSNNRVIRKIGRDGTASIVAGKVGESGAKDGRAEEARFEFPSGLAVTADDSIYVNDSRAIRKIDASGNTTTIAGSLTESGRTDGKGTAARFWNLTALALDETGNLYVADHELQSIRRVTPAGVVQTLRGSNHSDLPLKNPMALAVDARGRLYVANQDNHNILLIETAGVRGVLAR